MDGDGDFTSAPLIKLFGRKILYHLHEHRWAETYWYRKQRTQVKQRIRFDLIRKLDDRAFRLSDIILPNSKWLQTEVKKHLPNHRAEVFPNGVDEKTWNPDHITEKLNLDHPAVVGIMFFWFYPKILGLKKFFKVIERMPDVHFYFAGDGQYESLLKTNSPSNMNYLGRLSQYEIKRLLASGDIFVHPSGFDTSSRSCLEASLMKTPIIASNIGGIPEVVTNNETGYICEIDDTDLWIRKIRFLLDNQEIGKKLGANAREFVLRNFHWNTLAKKFVNILKTYQFLK
jgi:glycosyltransferase involved in cell wall biosynthesis